MLFQRIRSLSRYLSSSLLVTLQFCAILTSPEWPPKVKLANVLSIALLIALKRLVTVMDAFHQSTATTVLLFCHNVHRKYLSHFWVYYPRLHEGILLDEKEQSLWAKISVWSSHQPFVPRQARLQRIVGRWKLSWLVAYLCRGGFEETGDSRSAQLSFNEYHRYVMLLPCKILQIAPSWHTSFPPSITEKPSVRCQRLQSIQ